MATWTAAIEQAHHPLDQGQLGLAAVPREAAPHPFLAAEQGVEVAAWPSTHPAEQLGIEVVGSHLEGLQALAAAASQGGEAQAEQGFAAAAAGRCDKAGHGELERRAI